MKTLEQYIEEHTQIKEKAVDFVDYLNSLLDKYKFYKSSDLYNKANISRQLWSSIISGKSNPSLNVCLKIVFALKCDSHECKYLLKKAGYTLPSSNKYSLIIKYAIENKIHDLNEVNDMLIEYGYEDSLIY